MFGLDECCELVVVCILWENGKMGKWGRRSLEGWSIIYENLWSSRTLRVWLAREDMVFYDEFMYSSSHEDGIYKYFDDMACQ